MDARSLEYHLSQWDRPKRSTVRFEEFAAAALRTSRCVIDLGCGAGAATAYLAEHWPDASFTGIDLSNELVEIASNLAAQKKLANLRFQVDDWFKMGHYGQVDGVVSLQSLSWLPDFETPLGAIFNKLQPRWIAVSSLFYEGDISCSVEVHEHVRNRKSFYNVYSLPAVKRFCDSHRYLMRCFEPFEIDVDIPKPHNSDLMSTYTVSVHSEDTPRRLQLSGPLLMNWYFVMLERTSG